MEDLLEMKNRTLLILLVSSTFVTSCSWINKTTDRLMGRKRKPVKKKSYVSKAQYDDLFRKYEALRNKYEADPSKPVMKNHNASNKLLDDLNDLKAPAKGQELKTKSKASMIETVDVFGSKGLVKSSKPKSNIAKSLEKNIVAPTKNLNFDETNQEVGKYRQGSLYLAQGKNDLALRVFQELERSPLLQVRVRAIHKIGELLFLQGEYDLAMQVFENLVENYAFSGVVLDSLKKLVTCSEKLNLVEKRDRYHSMINDVFGV